MTPIPLVFWNSEIKCGRELGKGTYCSVLAVQDIILSGQDLPTFSQSGNAEEVQKSRQRLANRFAATRHKKRDLNAAIYGKPTGPPKEMDDPEEEPAPKLALKRVRVEGRQAKEDFQRELDILMFISTHPNIVDLRGIGFSPESREPSSLLLGQIKTTLAKRLLRWRDEKGIGLYEALAWDLPNRKNQWVERLVVLSRLAHAIHHMHTNRIVYRDTKPENVGFDAVLDIPKVFDFGLAKLLPADTNDSDTTYSDSLFHLTPETGTLRYMAVEVGMQQPYGWTADVYSLAILMHEVLSLKVPFGGIKPTQFREMVWTQEERLPIDPSWPATILELIPRMWQSNPLDRPSMGEVANTLDAMLRGSDEDLFPTNLIASPRRSFSLFT